MRRRLFCSNSAGDDICLKIVLTTNWISGQSAQHRQLPDVGERISDWRLKQLLRRAGHRFGGRKVVLKLLKANKEPFDLLVPRARFSFGPCFFSFRD